MNVNDGPLLLAGNLIIVGDKGLAQRLRQLAIVIRRMPGSPARVQIRKWYDGKRRWSEPTTVCYSRIEGHAPNNAATRRARDSIQIGRLVTEAKMIAWSKRLDAAKLARCPSCTDQLTDFLEQGVANYCESCDREVR